ncbi:DUF1801 domain-containing protein [Candidatus Saccharibacteria bacterium]|nr:DUF1801 domain-containing protein [Candidatus Saccharibacteria bacterium]
MDCCECSTRCTIEYIKEKSAAQQIDDIIALYGGWKGELLARIRAIILAADPDMIEEIKWKMRTRPEGLPVWSNNGIVCMTETFKDNIKLVFTKGAQMHDLQHHFNARQNSSTDRAIEFHDGEEPNADVITAIVHEAVRLNMAKLGK